jgi:hypothetical protein
VKRLFVVVLFVIALPSIAQMNEAEVAARYQKVSKEYLAAPKGSTDSSTLEFIAVQAYQRDADALALRATDEYVESVLRLGPKQAFTKANVKAMARLAKIGSQSEAFKVFYHHSLEIDQLMLDERSQFSEMSYSGSVVGGIIDRENIPDLSGLSAEPDWRELYSTISRKHNVQYADRVVAKSKVTWYRDVKKGSDKKMLCTSLSELIKNFGSDMSEVERNNDAWEVFESCDSPTQLTPAIDWMKVQVWNREGVEDNHNDIDTLANLCYRAGRKTEGMMWEREAITQAGKTLQKKPGDGYTVSKLKIYEKTLQLMQQDQPTWGQ